MEQDLRGSKYFAERAGKKIGLPQSSIPSVMRHACRKSRDGNETFAIHVRYEANSKAYVEVGRAAYLNGECTAISGTMKN